MRMHRTMPAVRPTRRGVALRSLTFLTLFLLCVQVALAQVASAAGGDFTITWRAADPDSYNHTTGTGGTWANVVKSLTGKDFTCGDRVVFLARIDVAAGATGSQDIEIDFSFDTQPSGQPGAGFRSLVSAGPNTGDGAMSTNGNEVVSSSQSTNAALDVTVGITNLEAGEVFILRLVVLLQCDPGSSPTGTIQSRMEGGRVVPGDDPIPGGVQTIPLNRTGDIAPAAAPGPGVSPTVPGGTLPSTGFSGLWLAVLAGVLVISGLALGFAARRRA